jgi:hypothetical protein
MKSIDPNGSSNILRIDYDEDNSLLEMQFKDGSVYNYPNVPTYVIDEFEAAESKGKYANANIYKQFPGYRV